MEGCERSDRQSATVGTERLSGPCVNGPCMRGCERRPSKTDSQSANLRSIALLSWFSSCPKFCLERIYEVVEAPLIESFRIPVQASWSAMLARSLRSVSRQDLQFPGSSLGRFRQEALPGCDHSVAGVVVSTGMTSDQSRIQRIGSITDSKDRADQKRAPVFADL